MKVDVNLVMIQYENYKFNKYITQMQDKKKSVNPKITYSKPQTTINYHSSYQPQHEQEIKHSTINSDKIERIEYLKEKQIANLNQQQKQIYRLGKGLFTYQEVARLKEAFEKYSSIKNIKKPPRSRLNANGVRQIIQLQPETQISLSEKELEKLFIDAQIPLHAQTLSHIFRQLVKKKGNGVSFANIMEIITLPSASLDEAEDYVNIFQMYDRNNRGYFDFEDYRYVCQGIAKDLSEDEIHQAFQAMNSDKSGKIDFGTFTKVMKFFKLRLHHTPNCIISYFQVMSELERLFFHDNFDKRQKWFQIFKDQIWTPRFNISLPAQRDLAYKQLSKVAKSGIVSVQNFINDPTNIFTSHQMIGTVSGSAATKFTVHYNLFGGTIIALHTDRHKYIFDEIDSLAVTGCFCLTELGYGNNAVQMQTTAVYDEKTQQFTINSPSVLSQKYWITNGAVHANYALVFAQTYVKGKHQGVNAFLVPIRDKQLKPFTGVEINDMGIKMGMNGIDNGALKFHNVKIPRVNLMNRYSDVDQNGKFTSDVKGIQQRFFKVTQRLLSGRLCIASMTLAALKTAIYISIKYSQQRKGVSPNGKSETPIFQYQLQKNALIPIVARTLALNMLHNYSKTVFANPKGHQDDLLMICCVDKTMIGWHSERSVNVMRQRSGGQGFLGANVFGQIIAATHAALTAEGDNRVLMVKVVKDLLGIFMKDPSYFYQQEYIKLTDAKQLRCFKTLAKVIQGLQKYKLEKLMKRMSDLKQNGKSNYEILMYETSDEIQQLALSYGQRLTIISCVDVLQKLTETNRNILANYFTLFAWEIIIRELPLLLLQGLICPKLAKELRLSYNDLIKVASKDINIIIESLNIPVHAIKIPIAKDYVQYNSYNNQGEVINSKL